MIQNILDGLLKNKEAIVIIFTISSTIFAASAFQKYWERIRAKAAATFLGLFEETVEDIIEITNNCENVQHSHISEDLKIALDTGSTKSIANSVKPPRMITNKVRDLKKRSYLLLAQISGKEALILRKSIEELQKFCISLSGAVYAKLEKNKDHLNAPKNIEVLNGYHQTLPEMIQQIKKTILPLIEGKDQTLIWIMGLLILLTILAASLVQKCFFIYDGADICSSYRLY